MSIQKRDSRILSCEQTPCAPKADAKIQSETAVQAQVALWFELQDSFGPIRGKMVQHVALTQKPNAPWRRIKQAVLKQAWSQLEAYLDGEDDLNEGGILAPIPARPTERAELRAVSTLPSWQERALQAELTEILSESDAA